LRASGVAPGKGRQTAASVNVATNSVMARFIRFSFVPECHVGNYVRVRSGGWINDVD
jgi:hypothetical protein